MLIHIVGDALDKDRSRSDDVGEKSAETGSKVEAK